MTALAHHLGVRTLNVSRPPVDRAKALLEYLWHCDERYLVLTEISAGGGSALIESVCRAAGYAVASSLGRDAPAKALGTLVIARGATMGRDPSFGPLARMPERALSLSIEGEGAAIRLIAVYGAASDPVRYSSAAQRLRKREWLTGFLEAIATAPPAPTLLVGDLNIVAPGHRDALPYVLAQERAAHARLVGDLGFTDLYAAHAPRPAAPPWVDHTGLGCRYDYVLATPDLAARPWRVDIDETPRLSGLTDHAALVAILPQGGSTVD